MKSTKIAALAIAISCSACMNSGGTNTKNSADPQAENKFSSQLALIESAFQKGTMLRVHFPQSSFFKTRSDRFFCI